MKQLFLSILVAAVSACVLPVSSQQTPSYYGATATTDAQVYINGEALTAAQLARLEELIGERVPAARYVLDADGNFGYEGQPERVNLAAYIRARQGQSASAASASDETSGGTSMYSTDSAGRGSSMVGYGNCVAMSTPTGTFLGSGC